MASASSMPVSWGGSAARKKLFAGEKLTSMTCICPRFGGNGQASGKTLYAVMNWNFPKTIFHVRKFKVWAE